MTQSKCTKCGGNYVPAMVSYPDHNGGSPLPADVCTNCGSLRATDDRTKILMRRVFAVTAKHPMTTKQSILKAISAGCYQDPHSCGLRWITAHPHGGGDEGKGIPLLVHDNGEEYTVVGGAGGRLNQTVFKKPAGSDDVNKAKKLKRQESQRKKALEMSDDEKAHKEKAALLDAKAKEQLEGLRKQVMEKVTGQFHGDVVQGITEQAKKEALKQKPDATDDQKAEFAKEAEKHGLNEAKRAAEKVIRQLLDHNAMRQLEGGDATPAQVSAMLNGKQLLKQFTPDEIDDIMQQAGDAAKVKAQANAIRRALKAGDMDSLQGIESDLNPISPEDAAKQNLSRYLNGKEVDANVNLVKASEEATKQTQLRNQAGGAVDALNGIVASRSGKAILSPEITRILGVENAGRVAASYLTDVSKTGAGLAEELRNRIATESYAAIEATHKRCQDMDDLVKSAYEAAEAGDGSYSKIEAGALKCKMSMRKYNLLNTARGGLRAGAALAYHLEHPSNRPMQIAGGNTAVGAAAKAKGLGLADGDFSIDRAKGEGYRITVQPENIGKLVHEHTIANSDRNVAMDRLKQDVEDNPGSWRPAGLNSNILLQPHQELAARAIVDGHRPVLNFQPGSGKTAIIYAAASQLMHEGKIDRALITMPAKPRAQQEDGVEDGKTFQGEIGKFLSPEYAKQFGVVKDGADLRRKLKMVKAGQLKGLVMSPQLMREKVEDLKAAGFGGDKSAYFADEAHEFAIGHGDGEGSGMARAAHEMAKSKWFSPMSGTLIDNNASELHSIYDMAHPGELGSATSFQKEYARLAQGKNDLYANEALGSMRDRLSGGMLTYHKPLTRKAADGTSEAVHLEKKTIKVPLSDGQKTKIASINAQYQKDKVHESPDIRAGASLKRYGAIKRALATGDDNPKFAIVRKIMEEEKAKSPQNRVGVYGSEISMLNSAQKAMSGRKVVRVTGGDDDKAVKNSVKSINDRGNNTDGVVLSNAANYGINLTGMDHLIKLHPLDTYSKEDQLDHRHHRTGQTRDVRATTLVSDHPVERMAQYRNREVKMPEVALLAMLAEDSHRSNILSTHLKDIQHAAGSKI